MFVSNTKRRLNRMPLILLTALVSMSAATMAPASEASSGASATANPFGPGTAEADAAYRGDGRGFARTNTRTGAVNVARGLAFGVDRDGISISASNAVAGRFLPGVASTFNLTIGRDGSMAGSSGLSVAGRAPFRSVSAGGFSGTGRNGAISGATASARSEPRGLARSRTRTWSRPAIRPLRRFRRH